MHWCSALRFLVSGGAARYVEYQRKQRMVLRHHKDALQAMANFWCVYGVEGHGLVVTSSYVGVLGMTVYGTAIYQGCVFPQGRLRCAILGLKYLVIS